MLDVPEDFESINSFADWYINNNMPIVHPADSILIETDDATAVTVFRHKQYQVEMYFMKAFKYVPNHGHPDVEVVLINYIGGNAVRNPVMQSMEIHGGSNFVRRDTPQMILSIQRWGDGVPVTSVAIHWAGYTAGKMHDKLISKYYPDALVKEGYADVRRDKLSGASYKE